MSNADKDTFTSILSRMPRSYWLTCLIIMLERFSYFLIRAAAPLFLVAAGSAGLSLDYEDKIKIFTVWSTAIFCAPLVMSIFADSYGYKRFLSLGCVFGIIGYAGMALVHSSYGFWMFLFAVCFAGICTGTLRPIVYGTIARSTTNISATYVWGIYFLLINVAGFCAPLCAGFVGGSQHFRRIAMIAGIMMTVAALLTYFFHDNHERTAKKLPFTRVCITAIGNMLSNSRFLIFSICASLSAAIYMIMWSLLYNFIEDWIVISEFSEAGKFIPFLNADDFEEFAPEALMLIHVASMLLLVVFVSYWIRKIQKIRAILLGILISLAVFILLGTYHSVLAIAIALLILAVGDIIWITTTNAYIGITAPRNFKAVYLTYFGAITMGIGSAINFLLAPPLSNIINKVELAKRYMVDVLTMDTESIRDTVEFPFHSEVLDKLAETMNVTSSEATSILWEHYHSYTVWYYLTGLGLICFAGMFCFYRWTKNDPVS